MLFFKLNTLLQSSTMATICFCIHILQLTSPNHSNENEAHSFIARAIYEILSIPLKCITIQSTVLLTYRYVLHIISVCCGVFFNNFIYSTCRPNRLSRSAIKIAYSHTHTHPQQCLYDCWIGCFSLFTRANARTVLYMPFELVCHVQISSYACP